MRGLRLTSAAVAVLFSACGTAQVAPPLKTSFEVLQDRPINNGSIREVHVRLESPVAEDQVKAVAFKVKNSRYSSCPKTKVWFLLPGQHIGGGAWASAAFRPKLEVTILGARAEVHQALKKVAIPADGKVLGEWIWDVSSLTRKITFIKRGDGVFMRNTFVSETGDSANEEKKLAVLGPNKYRYPGSDTTWMTINNKGELEFHDPHGLIDAARAVK